MSNKPEEYETILPATVGEESISLITKAEIDQQISTAKKYPRSIRQFINEALEMVTLNEEVAASCNYALPRGGKIIEGPSVRFAELIYSAWGNMRAGTRVVHEDSRFVTAQGICHDLQRNTSVVIEVKRRITDKKGKTFNDDMVGVTGNAATSIALRNAILRIVPKAYWQPLYAQARKVSMGDSKTLATRRADALAVLQKFGITAEMVFAKLEIKGIEDITLEHLATLFACLTSIKNGEATAEELFAPEKPAMPEAKGNEAVKERLRQDRAIAQGANPVTGEIEPVAQQQETPVAVPINSTEPQVQDVVPAFNINEYPLKTQAGIKDAVTGLCKVLAHHEPADRAGIFLTSGGNDLLSLMGRAGLGNLKQRFVELGINLPAQE